MSWQIWVWVGLAVVLVLGISMYELRRPSPKTIALVAALAAAAVAGRILFAALPNVQPTTDIVFLTGYVLGATSGAFVGALAALVSNIFFGQGPWTPWQMLAWGLVGIFGAGMGRLLARKCSRWVIAVCCAIAGIFFGLIMNFSLWITFTDPSFSGGFLVLQAGSLWFDIAHATGNLLIAAAVGPAMVKALKRYQRRFEVRWSPATAGPATLIAAVIVLTPVLYALVGTEKAAGGTVSKGVVYLKSAQNSDGGFGADADQGSSTMMTGWAAMGLAAAGESPSMLGTDGSSVIDYLRVQVKEIKDLGDIERTMIALHASGLPVKKLAGKNLWRGLVSKQKKDGSFSGQVGLTAFGVLALRAAGVSSRSKRVRRAVRWLERRQNKNGGIALEKGGVGDVDLTGATLQAFKAAGMRRTSVVKRAGRFLLRARNSDGGYGQRKGGESNGQSTAWAIQGLVAAGRGVARPIKYLRSLQQKNGSFRYSRTSKQTPVWVTAQALPALEHKTFPLSPVKQSKKKSLNKLPLPVAIVVAIAFALIFVRANQRIATRRRQRKGQGK